MVPGFSNPMLVRVTGLDAVRFFTGAGALRRAAVTIVVIEGVEPTVAVGIAWFGGEHGAVVGDLDPEHDAHDDLHSHGDQGDSRTDQRQILGSTQALADDTASKANDAVRKPERFAVVAAVVAITLSEFILQRVGNLNGNKKL